MEIVETIKKVVQEIILPEIGTIKNEYNEIKSILVGTNKRLDDINIHLVDQSRRIDETNKRIDEMNTSLTARIDETNKRIDETNKRMDALRVELRDELVKTNARIDRLYEVIVRRDEHNVLEMRIGRIEQEMRGMKEELLKLAA